MIRVVPNAANTTAKKNLSAFKNVHVHLSAFPY